MLTVHEILEPYFLSDDPQAVLDATREIERLSSGAIKTSERINARTLKPERDGLLCARIFGPVAEQCSCGFLVNRAGELCPKCGVLGGGKHLRDERWGHVTTPWPLLHPVLVPRIAAAIGLSEKDLRLVAGGRANLEDDGSLTKYARHEYFPDDAPYHRGPEFVRARSDASLFVSAVPVTPAGWRGARRDAQDDAYGRLVGRRNRLVRLLELNAPSLIMENDWREMQKNFERVCTAVRSELTARRTRPAIPRGGRGDELLRTALETPDHYDLRGVYADWLIEHGDPRGEFIALQLANTSKMGKRESELLARHYDEWLAPIANVVDYVVFRRGFLAGCRAQKEALPFIGDPIWATVEHLNTELPELVRSPTMRGLRKLSTNGRCLIALCKDGPLERIDNAVVRITRCPPKGWEVVDRKSLPALRDLVLLHQSSTGTCDWSWFLDTPLAQQLTSLTLGMTIERLQELSIARWLPIFERHPKLERLALSFDKKRLVFELRRTADGVELELTTGRSFVEQVCLMQEELYPPAIARALARIPKGALRIRADHNRWFGDSLEALGKQLRRRFRDAIAMPVFPSYA